MGRRETPVETKCCELAEADGWKPVKLHLAGWPDRVFFGPNNGHFFCELKAKGEKPTRKQLRKIAELVELGHHAFWCDNVEAFKVQLAAANRRVHPHRQLHL